MNPTNKSTVTTSATVPVDQPRLLLFTYGVNKYNQPGCNLQGCIGDVEDFVQLASEINVGQLRQLRDGEATDVQVMYHLQALIALAAPGDLIVVHNSSHGSQIPDDNGDEADGMDEVICPANWPKYISDDMIYEATKELKEGVRLVFVCDSCHSKTMERSILGDIPKCIPYNYGEGSVQRMFRKTKQQRGLWAWIKRLFSNSNAGVEFDGSGVLVLSGCQADGVSMDAHIEGKFRGAFTYHLLRNYRANKNLTWKQLIEKTRATLSGAGFTQKCDISGDTKVADQVAFKV